MKFTRDHYQYGSLRQVPRAKGPDVWEFRFSTYENGARQQRQITLSTRKYPTEAAVRRKVEALLLKLNEDNTPQALAEPTLGAVIDVYLREEMPERPKSQQNYRLLMERHIRPNWGEKVLSDVQPYGVELWLRELSYSPETKRHIKSMMYRLFELAMKRSWIEVQRNPMSLVHVKGRKRVVEKVVLTPDQMQIVRGNLKDPYLLMAELACYLGLRICEIMMDSGQRPDEVMRMEWSNVHFDRRVIFIPNGKTTNSRRFVPLSDRVDAMLHQRQIEALAQIAQIDERFAKKKISAVSHESRTKAIQQWVFPGKTAEGRRNSLFKQFNKARDAAGVQPEIVLYCARHTFATNLLAETGDLALVQRVMGHESISTTQKYLHPETSGVADIVNKRNQRTKLQLVA
jgi:integrase